MASSSTCPGSSSVSLTVLADSPHQPKEFSFPKRSFGKKAIIYRSSQASWFSSWKWLHYCESDDSVLCFLCVKATREKGVVVTGNLGSCDQAFVSHIHWKLTNIAS